MAEAPPVLAVLWCDTCGHVPSELMHPRTCPGVPAPVRYVRAPAGG